MELRKYFIFLLIFLSLFFCNYYSFGQGVSYNLWNEKMDNAKVAKEDGNMATAQKELEEALKLVKGVFRQFLVFGGSKTDKKIAIEKLRETLTPLVYIYLNTKNYQKLFGISEEGVQLSNYYFNNGDYLNAIEVGHVAKELLEKMNIDGLPLGTDYGVVLTSVGDVYYLSGDYQTALPLLRKGLKIIAQNEGKESPRYGMALLSLSRLYTKLGEYEKALPLAIESLKIKDWEADTVDRKLIKADGFKLITLANLYSDLGNHPKALSLSLEALKICEVNYGKEHSRYGWLLGQAASKYANVGDFKKALAMSLESLAFTENKYGKEHLNYGIKLGSLSRIYFLKGDYKKSLSIRLKAIKIIEDKLGNKHPKYAEHLSDLASLYNEAGDYQKAIPLLIEALKLNEEIIGKEHHRYAASQFNLATIYCKMGDYNNAIPLLLESNKNLLTHLDNVFKFRSEKEKKMFLETVLDNFDINQSIVFQKGEGYEDLLELNLNNQLVLKNLLLKSSKDISAKLATLNFSTYDKRITIYRYLKQELSKQLSLSMSERTISVDSLVNEINSKESELVKLYNSNFQDNINFSKNWKLSNQKLMKNEIAIEFSHYKLFDYEKGMTDKILYGAYIYKKDWEYPKLVSLFKQDDLKKVLTTNKNPNQLYNSDQLYNLIWKPLEEEIEGNKTVYYSPSGLLNQISFSAMESDEVQLINKSYDLVRLSSTSVLENGEIEPNTESTLFIGAINYEYLDAMDEEADSTQFTFLETPSFKNSKATRNRGETWEYLLGTEKEIKGLQSIFRLHRKSYNTLKGSNASEAKFKALSGNSPNILHIATHGFFYENREIEAQKNMNLNTEDRYRLAEDPLFRSGLILAGANYAWKNGSNPNEEEDGILTAMEISNLDLSNTDLVVLSACETGLGDIDGSEGVYGLQRAFKMAGVDIIIMSLWQVPDNETAEFMNLFYSNWIQNNNIKTAFNEAQRTMQQKYSGEPEKWAAFVMFE